MKTYAVAIFNHLDGHNRLVIVNATDEVDAAKKALIEQQEEKYRTSEYVDWVNGLGTTLDEVEENSAQGELCISNVIMIN